MLSTLVDVGPLPVLLLAGGALLLPHSTARRRLGVRGPRLAPRRPAPVLVLGAAVAIGVAAAGFGGAVAAGLATGTGLARWRARGRRRRDARAVTGLADALAVVVAELRVGAHAVAAVDAGALDGDPEVADTLRAVAAAARLGGDVPRLLLARAGTLAPWWERMATAWELSERHGVPLVDLLDAVRRDAEHRARFVADLDARLAGPRATATVLAGLPLLGVVLGQAVGAGPVQVLTGGGLGSVLLVVGTALSCAGVLWSARLVTGAVRA